LAFPRPLTIYDSTLRKILYVAGLKPSIDDLLEIASAVEDIGVREMALNLDWWGDATPDAGELEVCREVLKRNFAFNVTVASDALLATPWLQSSKDWRSVVNFLGELGAKTISPIVGDLRSADAARALLEQMTELFEYTRSVGLQYSVTVADAARFDFERLMELSNHALDHGAIRMDLCDSFNSLSLHAMTYFVRTYRERLTREVPVTMHVHDDFGLGSAMAIAAAAGGGHPDVAVNGVSYRSGFAALEEVAVSLEVLYGVDTGLQLDKLKALSDLVADRIGLPHYALKAISGPHAFLRDLPGLAIDLIKGGPDGFPPSGSCIAPSIVGAHMKFTWGYRNSQGIIRSLLQTMNLSATDAQVATIQDELNARLERIVGYPHWLDEDEVRAVCRSVLASGTRVT
jgi:D-citramalate synthase